MSLYSLTLNINRTQRKVKYSSPGYVLIVLLLSICSMNPAIGQTTLGPFMGYNNQQLDHLRVDSVLLQPGSGYYFGINLDLQLKKDVRLSISPGYVYEKGNIGVLDSIADESDSLIVDFRDTLDLRFRYFSIPIMIKVISDNKKFFFTAGPDFLIPINIKTSNGIEESDWSYILKEVNVTAALGIGYNFFIKNTVLSLEVRYSQSINAITNENAPTILAPNNIKTRNTRIFFSWQIPISKEK